MSYIGFLHELLIDLRACGITEYIRLNFLRKNIHFGSRNGKILNYSSPSIMISDQADVQIDGRLALNVAYPKKSMKKSVLILEHGSRLNVQGFFQAYYDTEIRVCSNGTLSLGSGYINAGTQLRCMERIHIGDECAIGRNVLIMDFDAHEITYENGSTNQITAPITIGRHVWIGSGVTILKGVTIGDGAVIGAGSVVTRDVPANSIAVGNPARVIRKNIQWK